MSSNVNNPNWWYKSHTYAITPTLNDYLQSHVIPEEEASYLCFIQNQVIVGCKRAEMDDQGYFRVSRQVWINKCGMNYTRWLDLLTSIGELEIDNSYHFLPPNPTPDQTENFIPKCKGFKVPYEKIVNGTVNIDFKKKQVHPLKAQKTIGGHTCGSSDDLHLSYLLECLQEVRVVDEPILDRKSVV